MMMDAMSETDSTMCEMTSIGFMINSLVGVMDSGVTAHGFEHYLLWDFVQSPIRFGYEQQFGCSHMA
jgi:hypothetical protein